MPGAALSFFNFALENGLMKGDLWLYQPLEIKDEANMLACTTDSSGSELASWLTPESPKIVERLRPNLS